VKVYHKLVSSPGMRYQDLGADYYDKRAQANRKARYHLTKLDALGYDVILTPRAGTDGVGTGQAPAA
jgi:transposase